MNKNVMSLGLFGLLVSAVPAQGAFEGFRNGLNRAGGHAHDHKAAYALVALAAFNAFAKKDLQTAAKKSIAKGKSIVHIGDKLVELAPLAFALAINNFSEHGVAKSTNNLLHMATRGKFGKVEGEDLANLNKDPFGTFLGSGTTLFATTGAAYSVYKHFANK